VVEVFFASGCSSMLIDFLSPDSSRRYEGRDWFDGSMYTHVRWPLADTSSDTSFAAGIDVRVVHWLNPDAPCQAPPGTSTLHFTKKSDTGFPVVRKFDGHVFEEGIVSCQLKTDLAHVLTEQCHPHSTISLLEVAAMLSM
jgi:hypothetical protein